MKIDKKFWIIFALVFISAIVIYIITFGSIDTLKEDSQLSLDERKLREKERHKKLLKLIEDKKELKRKLDNKFRKTYFTIRLIMVIIWILVNSIFYFYLNIKDLITILKYNEVFVLCLVVINFLSFGTITNLKSILEYFKNKLENKMYGNYLNIEEQIEKLEVEKKQNSHN